MKDMSVEELLSEVRFGKDALEATEELLRRYEALEKENKRLRYVINVVTIKTPRANDPSNLDTY